MNAAEVISTVDCMKPNEISEDTKFHWLNEANARVLCEIAGVAPEKIEAIACGDDELYVQSPYSRMYCQYILAMMFFVNGEYDSYVKAYAEYEKTFLEYAKYCIRNR